MKTIVQLGLLGMFAAMLPVAVQAQTLPVMAPSPWEFTTKNEAIIITKYTGPGGAVIIPGTLNGQPVVRIEDKAFWACTNVTSVTVPAGVTSVGDYAFGMCSSLKGVYFTSAAPSFGSSVFFKDENLTVYYLPGTSGWAQLCGDRPTARWIREDQRDAAGGKPSQ